jgi:hypothetical protein
MLGEEQPLLPFDWGERLPALVEKLLKISPSHSGSAMRKEVAPGAKVR